MERFLMRDLEAWRENPRRKPLIINGARQVGKTWLIKEFGRRHYESVAYVNMDNNAAMRELFDTGYDIDVLIAGLQLQTGVTIEPDSTLIVFDEVQENPKALTALKYFDEDPRGFSVVAAGSLLGILLQSGTGFPVGKVETLDLYPLSFEEFASGRRRAVPGLIAEPEPGAHPGLQITGDRPFENLLFRRGDTRGSQRVSRQQELR